jgi:calreticulin
MRTSSACALLLLLVACATATTYLKEEFDEGWEKRWVKSNAKEKEGSQGKWGWTAGEWFNDEKADRGLQTSEDSRFYGIAAQHPSFSNKGKTLVLQYEVKFAQKIDCGGGYLKFGPAPFPGEAFHGETPYNIMFGPDFCGYSTKKTHVIFSYKGKNHLIKKTIAPKEDQLTHLYTLIVKPDNSYVVEIDGAQAGEGKLTEDWDFLPAKTIPDPNDKKPSDWVDDSEMDDPEDKKPAGWDDTPKTVKDPEAKKPDDWDDALDGEWEAPIIDNPEYKGEWKAKRIPNPAYKGAWVQKQIANPEYNEDDQIYAYSDFSWVGIDVWQVKSGTIFDNIIITDSVDEAKAFAKLWETKKEGEKKKFDEHEEARKKKEEEERKAAEASKPADADDDDDDHDDHDGHDHDHDEL